MINATWLATFLALSEERHFTRTADRLHMTQPGVSQHIKKLENQIGTRLFTRQGQELMLTRAGEKLLEYARRQGQQEQAFRDSLIEDDPGHGRVRIACSGSLALLLSPVFLAHLKLTPNLQISLEAMPASRIEAAVLEDGFDLGISLGAPLAPRLSGVHIAQDRLCLMVPKNAQGLDRFTRLQALGCVGHPDASVYADAVFGVNFPEDYKGYSETPERYYINQINQILDPVLQGLSYAILPWSGVQAYPHIEQIKEQKFKVSVTQDLWISVRKGRELPRRVEVISGLIQDHLKKVLPLGQQT